MALYTLATVKAILGETGTSNDTKIGHYGDMADRLIISDTMNVNGVPNPPAVTADVISAAEFADIQNFADQIAVGYFYKFESGDTLTIEEAKENWKNWFNNKFRRPSFKVRGGETAN